MRRDCTESSRGTQIPYTGTLLKFPTFQSILDFPTAPKPKKDKPTQKPKQEGEAGNVA